MLEPLLTNIYNFSTLTIILNEKDIFEFTNGVNENFKKNLTVEKVFFQLEVIIMDFYFKQLEEYVSTLESSNSIHKID